MKFSDLIIQTLIYLMNNNKKNQKDKNNHSVILPKRLRLMKVSKKLIKHRIGRVTSKKVFQFKIMFLKWACHFSHLRRQVHRITNQVIGFLLLLWFRKVLKATITSHVLSSKSHSTVKTVRVDKIDKRRTSYT